MSNTRFTVRRLGWHQAPHGDHYTRRLPTAEAVAHFDNFDDAEYDRRRREYDARLGKNPFRFGGATLYFQSSLDNERLHDWFLDGGIEPAADRLEQAPRQLRHRDWLEWGDAFAHTWSEEQLAHAWQGLDKVRFFDVIEEPAAEQFRVMMDITTGAIEAVQEGGAPIAVYRHSRAAAIACAARNTQRREVMLTHGWFGRVAEDEERWERRIAEAVFFEAVEIPGHVPPHAGIGFLLQRRAFNGDGVACHDREGRDTGSRVPVQLFPVRSAANAHRDELIAAAQQVVNPFQVFTPEMAGLPEEFREAVAQLRAPLPHPTSFRPELWREWWDLCQDEITADQRAAAWDLFANHPLFEVLLVEVNNE